MEILFSENECHYRSLGLLDIEDINYTFNGLSFYNKDIERFDIFICSFYTMPHNVIITLKFKALNKKTIICSDGIFDFSNAINNPMIKKYKLTLFSPIIQDYFLCVGEKECNYFNFTTTPLKFMPNRMLSQSHIIELASNSKVLITTANTSYFNEAEFFRLGKFILDVVEVLEVNSIPFSFRIFDDRLLSFLVNEINNSIYNDIEMDFESTLKSYTSVITTPSSIAITSMYHQRSVSILLYRDEPMFLQAGWMIPSIDVFKSCLDDFLKLNKERMKIQNNFLKLYLSENDINDNILFIKNIDSVDKKNDLSDYINTNLYNMLDSRFNFNFEWLFRKLYLRFKKNKIVKKIRIWIK